MKNQEKLNEEARNRRKNNPEKFREIGRRSYRKNKKKAAIRMAKWREENIDKAKQISNDWKKDNPEKASLTRLSRYNLSAEDFNLKLKEQKNRCAICDCPFIQTPHVDHDHNCCLEKCHSCGKCIRGLLCKDCNFGLGRFKDDTEVLERAIQYLKKYNKESQCST
jgi:hypothetical protein